MEFGQKKKAVALISENPAIGEWIKEHKALCAELTQKEDQLDKQRMESFSQLQTILFEMGKITAEERDGGIGFNETLGVVFTFKKDSERKNFIEMMMQRGAAD